MKHLPPEGKKTLVELLQPLKPFGKDYRGLADSLGFTMQFINWLGSTNEPVVTLLRHIESIKITKVISHLEEMGRQDAVEDLRQFEGGFFFLGLSYCGNASACGTIKKATIVLFVLDYSVSSSLC